MSTKVKTSLTDSKSTKTKSKISLNKSLTVGGSSENKVKFNINNIIEDKKYCESSTKMFCRVRQRGIR
jgi:hypothetical protein